MNFWLTEPAKNDLISIWSYSAEQWSVEQADCYIDALDARIVWLTQNPGIWKSRPEIGPGLYSYPEQSHIIVFWEQHGGIEILRVLHKKMELQNYL